MAVSAIVGVGGPAAQASHGGWGGGNGGPVRASSYINPDLGSPTENPDVDPRSSCSSPDRYDTQRLSDPGTANRNVHNDACLYTSYWRADYFDGWASFDSTGVGFISACPDPDGAGPKTSCTVDRNGDGLADLCLQSGYQSKGMAGDNEYHARLNNTTSTGDQNVTFCYDPEQNGCSDSRVESRISVRWINR